MELKNLLSCQTCSKVTLKRIGRTGLKVLRLVEKSTADNVKCKFVGVRVKGTAYKVYQDL